MSASGMTTLPGLGAATRRGAQVGFSCALLYGALATLYILLRSSFRIGRILAPGEGLMGTLVANAFGVFWPTLITTLLLGVVAALVGMTAFVLIYALTARGRGSRARGPIAWIGFGVSALVVLVVNVLMIRTIGGYWGVFWPQGYLFWLGLPSVIFVAATTWLCGRGTLVTARRA